MRLYAGAGVDVSRVLQAVAFNATAFALGMALFGAIGLLWGAPDVAALIRVPVWLLRAFAALILLFVAGLILLSARRRELRVARWQVRLPPTKLILRQLIISIFDLTASAAALWFLLPEGAIALPAFFGWYAMAIALGLASHIPGGLGVFEAVILLACSGRVPPEQVLAALVLYRFIYYLLPLLLAAVLLAGYELRAGVAAPIARSAVSLAPGLLATLTFIAGGWLLISGATPATHEATQLLSLHVSLPIVEVSHFIGSIAGLALLIIARGLFHRLDAAWWAAFALSLIAAVLALPKGIALSEAAYLTALALLLLTSRRQFYRQSVLFAQILDIGWLLSIIAVVTASTFLLVFVYRNVDYGHELWWRFAFDAHAPRSLRAMTGVAIATLGIALWRLLRSAPRAPALPSTTELERAAAIVAAQPYPDANLALMGDKQLLFSSSGNAFIMFGRQARSWIALFDPVGPEKEWPELLWRFIEMAADHGARATCYQVKPQWLSMYLDAGLRAYKLGEYAYVRLADFSLKGNKRANLRQAVNRAEREGLSFAFVGAGEALALLPELEHVSDSWLAAFKAREKGFSLGMFDPEYMVRHPLAVIRQHGKVIAFANVLRTQFRHEATVDLMRHTADAPNGVMDFLFTRLLLLHKEEGYERFGLGMAPLSGLIKHELAPHWHRFGGLLFEHGETFYHFRGLRSFKEKFLPTWEPRYFAAPGGVAALAALADVTMLISRGPRLRGTK